MAAWFYRLGLCLVVWALLGGPLQAQMSARSGEGGLLDLAREADLEERDLARDRYEVSQASVKNLARRRLEAARRVYQERYREFLQGRGPLDILLEIQSLVTRAQQPPVKPRISNRQALEEKWRAAWMAYQLAEGGYEAGRVSEAGYWQSLHALLDVEVDVAMTRPKK